MNGPEIEAGHAQRSIDALIVGEALIDEVVADGETTSHAGGSPYNVAIGLARLGVPTLLHTALGEDHRGALLQAHASTNGVFLTAESLTATPTSYARATIGTDGSADYDFTVTWQPRAFAMSATPRITHAGSIGAAMLPGADFVAGVLSALKPWSIISLDPNVRPQLTPDRDATRRRLLELVALADVVKVSDEDLSWLCPGRRVEDVASEWLACGPDLVVVTRGRDGADAFGGWGTHHSAPHTTVVADTIGAGDSFMAGLLFALVDHGVTPTGERIAQFDRTAITQSVDFATRCAAITVGRPGADPPRRDELH